MVILCHLKELPHIIQYIYYYVIVIKLYNYKNILTFVITYLIVSRKVLRSLISSGMRLNILFKAIDFLFNS